MNKVFTPSRANHFLTALAVNSGPLSDIAASAGIAALIKGLISIVRSGERYISVYLAVGFGLITSIFVLGEIIFPH
ncbi:hypothetical protein ACFLWM_01330 [Chloroflexota bacterium]